MKETDAIKSKLENYSRLQRLIDNQISRLETITARMSSISSPNLSGQSCGNSDNSSKQERLVIRKLELEENVKELIYKETMIRGEISALLEKLENPDERAVIEMRYIDRQSWWSITEMLYGKEPNYSVHKQRYLKRALKIHGYALQSLAGIENNTTDGNNL